MGVRELDQEQYWVSFERNKQIWSRAFCRTEVEGLPYIPGLRLIEAYRVDTSPEGKVSFTPIKNLDELKA